jgi:hypothetical protein
MRVQILKQETLNEAYQWCKKRLYELCFKDDLQINKLRAIQKNFYERLSKDILNKKISFSDSRIIRIFAKNWRQVPEYEKLKLEKIKRTTVKIKCKC